MRNNNMVVTVLVVAVLILAVIVYQQANRPKTPGEKIDVAITDVGSAVENAGDKIKDATN